MLSSFRDTTPFLQKKKPPVAHRMWLGQRCRTLIEVSQWCHFTMRWEFYDVPPSPTSSPFNPIILNLKLQDQWLMLQIVLSPARGKCTVFVESSFETEAWWGRACCMSQKRDDETLLDDESSRRANLPDWECRVGICRTSQDFSFKDTRMSMIPKIWEWTQPTSNRSTLSYYTPTNPHLQTNYSTTRAPGHNWRQIRSAAQDTQLCCTSHSPSNQFWAPSPDRIDVTRLVLRHSNICLARSEEKGEERGVLWHVAECKQTT